MAVSAEDGDDVESCEPMGYQPELILGSKWLSVTTLKVNAKLKHQRFNMTPRVCRAARAILDMTQRDLGVAAGVSAQTVADFERGARTPHLNNLQAIRVAFERQGLTFVMEGNRIVAIDLRAVREPPPPVN